MGLGAPVFGQMRDYGQIPAKTQAAFEAGIEDLRIVRYGQEERIHECSISIDILGKAGVIGVSEILFPGEDLIERTMATNDLQLRVPAPRCFAISTSRF